MPGKAANTQEARIEGENAFFSGLAQTANPYHPKDDRHFSWQDGWCDASLDGKGA